MGLYWFYSQDAEGFCVANCEILIWEDHDSMCDGQAVFTQYVQFIWVIFS